MAALHEETLLFTFFLLFHPSFSILGNITDEQALLAFKAGLISDPFQLTASWNESTSFCEWGGITCGRKHQRVVKLNLSSSNLQGSLSPAIGNLSFLRMILLNKNSLSGIIPSEIGRLSRLNILSLANNSLSGEIPKNISQCRVLEIFDLGGNNLTGKLPVEFQSLSKLQFMYAYRNKLTGRIPPQYGNLSSLIHFAVHENNLPSICHISIALSKMWVYTNSFFILCNAHIKIMQLIIDCSKEKKIISALIFLINSLAIFQSLIIVPSFVVLVRKDQEHVLINWSLFHEGLLESCGSERINPREAVAAWLEDLAAQIWKLV